MTALKPKEQNSTVGLQRAAGFVCVCFQSKKDLCCFNKVFQKYARPTLCFASKYAMKPVRVTKDIIFIYMPMVHLKFECCKVIKTDKKLYEVDFPNLEDSYD